MVAGIPRARRQRNGSFGRVLALGACLGAAPVAACSEPERSEPTAVTAERAVWTGPLVLTADDRAQGDSFGAAVALEGNVLVVGAPYCQIAGTGRGAVYVFEREGQAWVQKQKLYDAAVSGGARFGTAVALSGDRLVIGAPVASSTGAVYVYERSAGSFAYVTTITSPVAGTVRFGAGVGVHGDAIAVGAPGYSSNRGAAWIFERTNGAWASAWSVASSEYAELGARADISATHALFGAPLDDQTFQSQGSARLLVRSTGGWTLQAKWWSSTTVADRFFGQGVSLDGDRILIGERGNQGVGTFFEHSAGSWSRRPETITPIWNDTTDVARAVAVSGSRAAVSAPGWLSDPGGAQIYVREPSAWVLEQHVTVNASSLANASIALTSTHLALGTPQDSAVRGSVHVFELGGSGGSGGAGAGGSSGAAGSGASAGNGGAGDGGAGASAGGASGGNAGTGGAGTGGAEAGGAGAGGAGAGGAGAGGGGDAGTSGTSGASSGGDAGAGAEGGEAGESGGTGSGGALNAGGRSSSAGGSGGASAAGESNEAGSGGEEPAGSGGTAGDASSGRGGVTSSTGGSAASGAAGSAGRAVDETWASGDDSGCGCRVAGGSRSSPRWLALAAALVAARRGRRRMRATA